LIYHNLLFLRPVLARVDPLDEIESPLNVRVDGRARVGDVAACRTEPVLVRNVVDSDELALGGRVAVLAADNVHVLLTVELLSASLLAVGAVVVETAIKWAKFNLKKLKFFFRHLYSRSVIKCSKKNMVPQSAGFEPARA
jgi:hypothetical protein